MISVLEDTTTLDETILDVVARCARCETPAEYHVRGTCCPAKFLLCGECETELNAKWQMTVILSGAIICTHCRTVFISVEQAVKVNAI